MQFYIIWSNFSSAAPPRAANDNLLITVTVFDSFPLLFTVWFAVTKEADFMPKRRANGEGNI